MSNATYKQDLHDISLAVATNCKLYCDKRIDDLEWQIGTYNYDVATDSNVARIKTLPSDTYKSKIDYIGGKTVKYNQLVELANNTQSFTANIDTTKTIQTNISCNANDKLLVVWYQNTTLTSNTKNTMQYTTISDGVSNYQSTSTNNNLTSGLKSWFIQPSGSFNLKYWGSMLSNDLTISNIVVINLTQNYGSGNEPSTVETAISLLKANGYKLDGTDTYSTNKLKHAITTSVNFLPINVWDEETELGTFNTTTGENVDYATTQIRCKNLIEVLPSITYYFKTPKSIWVIFYDSNMSVIATPPNPNNYQTSGNSLKIENNSYIMPSNAYYMKFYVVAGYGTTYNNDICINISNASYNGNYYPYVAPITKAIPSEALADARYGLGFDNTNYNHLDNDGHLRGSWGIVDLGDFTYTRTTSYNNPFFYCSINGLKINGNAIASIYNKINNSSASIFGQDSNNLDFCIGNSTNQIFIRNDSYTTAEAFKTAMSGVYLVYELATTFDQDYSQYFTDGWNKVDLDKQYATCEMVVAEPIDMPNSITNLIKEVKA